MFLGDKLKFFLPFEEGCSQTDTDKIYSYCLSKLVFKVQLIDSFSVDDMNTGFDNNVISSDQYQSNFANHQKTRIHS